MTAMKSLHKLKVIHRDLKPENILFNKNYLKLGNNKYINYKADLGCCY